MALLARGRAGLEGAARDVQAFGGSTLAIPVDVADADAVERAADRVELELGPIDLWINNAMASVFSPVKEMKAEEYRRVTEVTYLGTVHGTLAALRRMTTRDRGHILQIGSALAYRGIPLQSAYCAAKHAVQGFCDSLRAELLHDGSAVKISMIQLPAVNTPQFGWVKSRLPNKAQPVPPIFQPEMIAEAVLWLADHPRREMILAYPAWKAILGNKIAPGYADRKLAENGYSSQQTDEPEDPHRPDNLWSPQDEEVDHGAHGAFDDRATYFSPMLWAEKHHAFRLAAIALAVGGIAAGASLLLGRSHER